MKASVVPRKAPTQAPWLPAPTYVTVDAHGISGTACSPFTSRESVHIVELREAAAWQIFTPSRCETVPDNVLVVLVWCPYVAISREKGGHHIMQNVGS